MPTTRKDSGITLLELLIAFAILALVLFPFLQSFLTTGRVVKKRGEYITAIYLCQKIIENIRYDLYNEDSTDFSLFLTSCGETGRVVVPGPECSRFFRGLFDTASAADRSLIKQLDKFTVTIDCGEYFVPLNATAAQQAASATVDVNGDCVNDPDAALVTVTVMWKERSPSDNAIMEKELKFSTIISKNQDYQREQLGDAIL